MPPPSSTSPTWPPKRSGSSGSPEGAISAVAERFVLRSYNTLSQRASGRDDREPCGSCCCTTLRFVAHPLHQGCRIEIDNHARSSRTSAQSSAVGGVNRRLDRRYEIGRASCRGRGEECGVGRR